MLSEYDQERVGVEVQENTFSCTSCDIDTRNSSPLLPPPLCADEENLCRSNPKVPVTDERRETILGVNYTCSAEYRMKTCATECTFDGKLRCCGYINADRMKKRLFTCKPDDPNMEIIMKNFDSPNPKGCQCFDCEDVCPAPGFSGEKSDEDVLITNSDV